jgi:hypothetical protein
MAELELQSPLPPREYGGLLAHDFTVVASARVGFHGPNWFNPWPLISFLMRPYSKRFTRPLAGRYLDGFENGISQ